MKPLIVLLSVFIVSIAINKVFRSNYEFELSGRIALSVMLVFTALAHFVFTKGMIMMLPGFIPYKTGMVCLTGIVEIVLAIGLLIPGFKEIIAWLLIAFFILLLPANIYAAIKHVDYQNANFDGITESIVTPSGFIMAHYKRAGKVETGTVGG